MLFVACYWVDEWWVWQHPKGGALHHQYLLLSALLLYLSPDMLHQTSTWTTLQSDNIHFTRPWSHLVFMQEITTLTSSLLQKIEYINTNKAILQSVCKKICIHCVSCTNSLDKFQKRIFCIVWPEVSCMFPRCSQISLDSLDRYNAMD